MASFLRHIPAVLVFVFALISLIFSIVGIVSKEWAVRDNFNTRLNVEDWDKPLYTLYRSPFLICSSTFVNGSNTTAHFTSDCERWKPFGFGKTSCESANATGNDTASNVGDTRLCQQIHFAGNFAITSTTFIAVATLLTLIPTILTILGKGTVSEGSRAANYEPLRTKHNVNAETQQVRSGSPVNAGSSTPLSTTIIHYTGFFALVFMGIAIISAVIAQLYAILGLTMSLPNNSDFSSSSVGSLDDVNTQGSHGPWYQGKALSTYWTCAWGFALAAGVLASRVWTLPRWS